MRLFVVGCCLLAALPVARAQPPPAEPAPPPAKPSAKVARESRLDAKYKCAVRAPTCDWVMTFSSLERLSIRRALAEVALDIDPAPWGKRIGTIRIYNEDVFAETNWLQFFNNFHVTTAPSIIRGELTFAEGEVWDDARVAESARRLKDPLFTTVIAVLPTRSGIEGTVDVLVVTRDLWSLRFNTKWAVQQDTLTNLSMSLSENNLLGRRQVVALGLLMDQGALAVGPLFIDKNFLGQHLNFATRVDRILTRQALDVVALDGMRMATTDPVGLQDAGVLHAEGTQATVSLSKPLWSLASIWGGGGSFTYRDAIARSYFGTGLRAVDDPTTPGNEFLPREYRMRVWSARASVIRQWGSAFKHQLEVGYSVSSEKPSPLPNFPAPAFFIDSVFPREEVISSPFVEYTMFQPSYRTVRNVDTLDLAEDYRLGPTASVGVQQSLRFLGADYYFTRPSLALGWTFAIGDDGFLRVSSGGQVRIQGGRTIDSTATGGVRFTTPTLRYLRLITQAYFETRWNDTENSYYALGSESGLRGYNISQFIGDRRVVGQLEARSVAVPLWVLRLGGVAFYEAGGAANSFHTMKVYQDVGLGLRVLIPQTARDVLRFDLAFPLVPALGVRQGFPRFVAGFESYF